MSSNINWMGNKVFDSSASRRQSSQPATASNQQDNCVMPSNQMQQGNSAMPLSSNQQGNSAMPMQKDNSAMPMQQGNMAMPSNMMQKDNMSNMMQEGGSAMPSDPPPVSPPVPAPPGSIITQQGPPPSTERGYIPYYLASNIGKSVRAEFIIGSNQYADKTGILIEVGINYFVLLDVNSRTHIMCDLYSVKFVTILQP